MYLITTDEDYCKTVETSGINIFMTDLLVSLKTEEICTSNPNHLLL